MLKHLQKFFTAPAEQPSAQAETNKEDVTMTVKETGAALVAANTEAVAGLTASLASTVAELATAQAKIVELSALVEAAVAFKAAQAEDMLKAKTAARKLAVVAAVGTDKADALLAATTSLEDEAFNAVMAAMTTASTVEAKSSLFTESGVDAAASATLADSNPTMDYLTAKYKQA